MQGESVWLAVIAIFAAMVSVLVWLIKEQFKQSSTNTKESNESNRLLAESINKLSNASEEQIRASRTRDEEQRTFQQHVIDKLGSIDGKADELVKALPERVNK